MREGLLVGGALAEPQRAVAKALDLGRRRPLLGGGARRQRAPHPHSTHPALQGVAVHGGHGPIVERRSSRRASRRRRRVGAELPGKVASSHATDPRKSPHPPRSRRRRRADRRRRPVAAAPEGQVTWGVHTTLVPSYFDPAETTIGTSFMVLYAHPRRAREAAAGQGRWRPSLAESWTVSPDGLVYEFVLRKGAQFHNGEPVTADDAKFSFERYRGIHAKTLKERVAAVETPDAGRVRIRLKQPWPDFMTYFGTVTTSAAWVVPKQVRREGRRGRLQEGADRRRALSLRVVLAGDRAGAGGLRRLLAQDAGGQAPGHARHPRSVHAPGGPQARRGRRGLLRASASWPTSCGACRATG